MASIPKVFISHTSSDKKILVKKLATDLRSAGAQVFYDEWSIPPAERLRDKISTAIRDCTHFIAVISNRSLKSKWVRIELDQAFNLQIRGTGPRILPVIFGNVDYEQIPPDILGLRWVQFRTAKGPDYEKSLLILLKALNLGLTSHEVPFEEIRAKQAIFVREHLAGTLNYDAFWLFWNKPMAAANWDKLLYVIRENVLAGQIEEARTNVEILTGMLQMYGISVDSPPRMLAELLSLPPVAENGILLGWLLQLTNLFRILLDKDVVLRFLSSVDAHVVHAASEYIEETGLEIDDEIAGALLRIVESPDDQHYYFSGADHEGNPKVVDSRRTAAIALMLADPPGIGRKSIIRRVQRFYPSVVEDIGKISLKAMVNSSFGGSHRKSIPAEGFDMDATLNEILGSHEQKKPRNKSGSKVTGRP